MAVIHNFNSGYFIVVGLPRVHNDDSV